MLPNLCQFQELCTRVFIKKKKNKKKDLWWNSMINKEIKLNKELFYHLVRIGRAMERKKVMSYKKETGIPDYSYTCYTLVYKKPGCGVDAYTV